MKSLFFMSMMIFYYNFSKYIFTKILPDDIKDLLQAIQIKLEL